MNAHSSEHKPVHDGRAGGAPAGEAPPGPGLAHVREQVIELLTRLDRPPRELRVRAGTLTLDITWDEQKAGAPGEALTPSAPPGPVAGDGASPAQTVGEGTEYLTSPAVGIFYHAREPGTEPFVSVGRVVQPGQQIGIVEAMKLMIPVDADRAGRITAVLKDNGTPVEYDEPLFAIDSGEA